MKLVKKGFVRHIRGMAEYTIAYIDFETRYDAGQLIWSIIENNMGIEDMYIGSACGWMWDVGGL